MTSIRSTLPVVFAIAATFAQAEVGGDPDRGESLYRQCSSCHQVGADAKDRVGPHLNGIFDRAAAQSDGFRYSPGLQRAATNGLIWDFETLNIPEASPTAAAVDHTLAPEILAIVGDPAYGEYLSGECTACHQTSGAANGIPSITGWPTEDFVIAMHAYKDEVRPHPVMQMMAGRLSNEEIAALAAYFKDVE